jgi:hypothetical protein
MNCEPRFWRDGARVTPVDVGRGEFDWMKLALNDAAPLGLDGHDTDAAPGRRAPSAQDGGRGRDTSWRWPTGSRIRHPLRPARTGRDREPPRRRVPDRDIVYVGAAAPHPADDIIDVRELAPAPPPAQKSKNAKRRGNLTRPLLVLLLLEVAVFGAIHLRKRLAEAHVIVVPATADERSVIT